MDKNNKKDIESYKKIQKKTEAYQNAMSDNSASEALAKAIQTLLHKDNKK